MLAHLSLHVYALTQHVATIERENAIAASNEGETS